MVLVISCQQIYFDEVEFLSENKNKKPQVLTTFVKEMINKYKVEFSKFNNAEETLTMQKAFEEQGFGIKVEYVARTSKTRWCYSLLQPCVDKCKPYLCMLDWST
jgi:hypothetical protein